MTLEQLEDDVWPEPDYPSSLAKTCGRLRKKPLRDFRVEDLRIMLGQSIGAIHLLPKAIELLEENPFVSGDFFEGDLLVAVARHPESTAQLTRDNRRRLSAICQTALNSPEPRLSKTDHCAVERLLMSIEAQD